MGADGQDFGDDETDQEAMVRFDFNDPAKRETLLTDTANNAEVFLICHLDTWNYMELETKTGAFSGNYTEIAEGAITEEGSARVRVPVSGRTLAAIMGQMMWGATEKNNEVDRAVSAHVRNAIAYAVITGDGLPFIIIDPHPDDAVSEEEDDD